MAGDTFDAGTVFAESRLDRTQFQKDLKEIKKDLQELSKNPYKVVVQLSSEKFKEDTKKLQAEFDKATKGQFVIRPLLDGDQFDAQMRALLVKWRKEQLTLALKLDDAAFEAEMRRVEAKMKSMGGINIPVRIDSASLEAELAKLSRELAQAGQPLEIPVKLTTAEAKAQVDTLRATSQEPIVVPVDARTEAAKSKVRALMVWIGRQSKDVVVNIKMKDIKKAISFLGSMSYRVSAVGRAFDTAGNFADRNLKKMISGTVGALGKATQLTAAIMMMGGAALGIGLAGSAALGLAADLKQAAGAGIALPGVIFTAVSGIAALKIGMSGVGDALKNAFDPKNAEKFNEAMKKLAPSAQAFVRAIQSMNKEWTALKLNVQAHLFDQLGQAVKALGQTYMPMLSTTLAGIADGFNYMARSVIDLLMSQRGFQDMNTILGNSAHIWGNIATAIAPVVSIILDLAAVAMPILAEMSDAIGGWADRWASNIHAMRETGQLADMLSKGFDKIAMIIGFVSNVLKILNSIMDAASRAGFGVFQNYTLAAGALERFLKSAQGMAFLDQIFGTLAVAMKIVQPFLNELARVLVQVVLPAVVSVMPMIAQGFAAIAPALDPLGKIIAAVLPVVVQLAVAFAQNLANALIFLAPYIIGFANMLRDNPAAAAALAGAVGILGFAFTHLGTILGIISKIIIFNKLRDALTAMGAPGRAVEGVLAKILGRMSMLTNALKLFLGPVGVVIGALIAMYMNSAKFRDAVNNLFGAIMGLVGSALKPFATTFTVLAKIAGEVAGVLGDILAPMVQFLADRLNDCKPLVEGIAWAFIAWKGIGAAITVINAAIAVYEGLVWAATAAQWAWDAAMAANPIGLIAAAIVIGIALIIGAALLIYKYWGPISDFFVTIWKGIGDGAVQIWEGAIKPVIDGIGAGFMWLYTNVLTPVGHFFADMWNAISTAVSDAWNNYIYPVLAAIGNAIKIVAAILLTILITPFVLGFKLMSAIATWLWSNVLAPFFSWLGSILVAVGGWFVSLWTDYVVPAWNAIAYAVQVGWMIISAIFGLIANVIYGVLAAAWNWLYANVVAPVWNAIVAVVQWALGVLQAIWGGIVAGLNWLGSIFTWLWVNVVVPVWNGISAAISAAWNFISGTFNTIVSAVSGFLAPIFTWLWVNIIQPVWNGIQNVIGTAVNVIQGIFNTLSGAVHAVGQVFSDIANWIGQTWDSIKEKTRAPVAFVVNTVYNGGIVPVWNGIAGMFGLGQLGPAHFATGGVVPEQYATGGVLGGYQPGRDSVLAMLSPGEGVLVPEAVKGLGVGFVGWANSFFAKGRVAGGANYPQGMNSRMQNYTRDEKPRRHSSGGIVKMATGGVLSDGILGRVDPQVAATLPLQGFDIGGIVSGAWETMTGFVSKVFTDPVGAVKELFSSVIGSGAATPGQGSWTDALKQIPVKTVEGVIAKVKKWVEDIMSMGGGGNWAPVILQSLAMVGEGPGALGFTQRRLMQESGGNPTIVNDWDSNWQAGHPSVGLMQVIGPTFAGNAGPLRGVGPFLYGTSVNPLANIYSSMVYTKRTYGSLAAGYNKANGYANGGILKPGELGYNETGQEEYVFNRNQLRTVINGGGLGTPQSVGASTIRGLGGGGKGSGNIDTLIVQAPQGATAKETVDEAVFAWKHANNGKFGGTDR